LAVPIAALFRGEALGEVVASGPLIAVVDDDVSLREALTGLLSAYGYDIDAYSSGHDLLASGRLPDYAVFILDVQMPDIDGLQLQEAILDAEVDAPIIFLTSDQDPEVRSRALAMGAAAFLSKPFHSAELLAQLDGALTEAKSGLPRDSGRTAG
jgi:FixJ family two-component response regulator